MFVRVRTLLAMTAAVSWLAAGAGSASASSLSTSAPHYDHIFVIVMENHSFTDVIGNPAAPNLNALAKTYGVATNYFAATHPSEPNYVALLGGSPFTVSNDNAYYINRVAAPSLISELDQRHVTWKAYLQSLPHPGYQGICYPANCNGAPDKDPLYVSKHDGIQNFTTSLHARDWSRQVPAGQLAADLRSGHVPAFSWVIPDECHDQHGDPPYCLDSGSTGGGDPQDQRLLTIGDRYLGHLVAQITHASFWAKGNNAIDVVYDEGDTNAHGGGRVAEVMITSHGPRHATDATLSSHYSLLLTIQKNFGLPCLQHSCDPGVRPLSPLLKVTGSAATPFTPVAEPVIAAPAPVPHEPVKYTTATPSGGGWTVQQAPMLGANDNTYGAVAAVSAHDAWAVGNFLPDTKTSNQDATLATAAHFNGRSWKHTPVPDYGPNFNTLFGVAATARGAWAVGVGLDRAYRQHAVVDAWNGRAWRLARLPGLRGAGSALYGATALSARDVWAVGDRQSAGGMFRTLIEHWNGHRWSVVRSPDPGVSGDHLWGIASAGPRDIWAVGQADGARRDAPLVEHWDGRAWHSARVPSAGLASGLLQSVAVSGSQVWAVGQSDDAAHQARPLVVHLGQGGRSARVLRNVGTGFSDMTGVAISGRTVWIGGSAFDARRGTEVTVLAKRTASGWHQVHAPNPGSGDNVLGTMSAADGIIWTAGFYKTDAGRSPLIEIHR